ncbi:uncharacterized protein RCO7_14842 [Rhynchosporium graminicola]|uniref:Uncharacterized protein n=1 Tax=Rhynchosporium graminicola TaxID=2792576 RepID=A0A1E1L5K1_9HELO|nr:uncharacterized protein RCO7_14842 [Rhynchosporium commune]
MTSPAYNVSQTFIQAFLALLKAALVLLDKRVPKIGPWDVGQSGGYASNYSALGSSNNKLLYEASNPPYRKTIRCTFRVKFEFEETFSKGPPYLVIVSMQCELHLLGFYSALRPLPPGGGTNITSVFQHPYRVCLSVPPITILG